METPHAAAVVLHRFRTITPEDSFSATLIADTNLGWVSGYSEAVVHLLSFMAPGMTAELLHMPCIR